ncbi:MAG: protein translocase subunit SecD, partial [Phycisphaerae bacterium]|nr:protein translocase subunit SecD [Phycisphaerae bacterium]
TAMAGGREDLAAVLTDATGRYDELQEARAAYEKVKGQGDAAIEAASRVARAEQAFDGMVDRVVDTSVDPAEILRVLQLSPQDEFDRATRQPKPGTSPRAKELAKIYDRYPRKKVRLAELVAAYDAYYTNKRPLEDAADLKRMLRGAGVLEFRITVDAGQDAARVPNVAQLRQQLADRGPRGQSGPARWFVLDDPEQWLDDAVRSERRERGGNTREITEKLRADMENSPEQFFATHVGHIGARYGDDYYLLLWDSEDRSITGRQKDWKLTSVTSIPDDLGLPAIGFDMNTMGASLMANLTRNNVRRSMAIVLDGRIYTAPSIQEPITGGSGRITGGQGGFGAQELEYLINTLGAGSLGASLSEEPVEERTIQPTIGADNLQRGLSSTLGALIAVCVFMVIYYFFAGLVADLALAANLVIILGIMAMQQATFTLPGIAGVVLTIGMCVDANVLIFERIREELSRGAEMAVALRLGYQKAFSSIIDGNLTNLIVCFILGYTASADVQGFAVTLGIGICATLFTSLFMTRAIFDIFFRLRPGAGMSMLPTAIPAIDRLLHPNIDWIKRRGLFFAASAVLVVTSLTLIVSRGENILAVEFRAGTDVAFNLKEGQSLTLEQVRQRLASTSLPEATPVALGDPVGEGYQGFSVITTETRSKVVAAEVEKAFSDVLEVKPPLTFKGSDQTELVSAPVFAMTDANLGQVIGRAAVENQLPDFLGGVAIVLEGITPSVGLETVRERVDSMRRKPPYDTVTYLFFEVVGLEPDPTKPGTWKDVAVVSRDPTLKTNVFENRAAWEETLATGEWNLIRDALTQRQSLDKISNFTPTVAETIRDNAVIALALSIIAIVVYIWFRFGSLRYGLAAIAALVHDVSIALGCVALAGIIYAQAQPLAAALLLTPFKIGMPMIAALLTIIGYSLNDTIVLFDRIRENRGKLAVATPGIINDSINQVISRTLLTSLTTFMAVFVMYVGGGAGIHGFAFALVVGVIVGTYSSIAIASPLLLIGTKYAILDKGSAAAAAGVKGPASKP